MEVAARAPNGLVPLRSRIAVLELTGGKQMLVGLSDSVSVGDRFSNHGL